MKSSGVLQSVMAVRKSGVLLFYVELGDEIRFFTEKTDELNFDPIMMAGLVSAIINYSEWLGDRLQAILLEKRTMWVKKMEDFTLVMSIERGNSMSSEAVINHLASELADSLAEGLMKVLGMVPENFLVDENGIGELFGEIVKREGQRLSDSNVQQLITRLDEENMVLSSRTHS
jgi:hypothetical protein